MDFLRPLGATGLRVSAIGLGTVKLGRAEGVKYPRPVVIPDDHAAAGLLARAADMGVNLIDTAPAYGCAEERLGRLLPAPRDRWVICTKAGEEFTGGVSTYDFSPAAIRASAERSLTRLRAHCLDVLLIHSDGDIELRLEESGVLDALRDLKRRGLARAIGVSTRTPAGALACVPLSDVVMLTVNRLYDADLPAVAAAAERGVGVLVKKVFASGRLLEVAQAGAQDAVKSALAAAFAHPVSSVVVGTANPESLRRNVAAARELLAPARPATG